MRPAAKVLASVILVCGQWAYAQPDQSVPTPNPDEKTEAADEQPATEEKTQATAAYAAGVAHFKAKRYEAAILEFNKAYRVDPNPVLVFNMARAFEELKDYDSAIEYYRRYLEMAPESDDAPSVADALRALQLLRKNAAEAAKVALTVTSEPDGALIFVDGHEAGTAPMKLELPAGTHYIAAESDGHSRASGEVALVAGEPATHNVVLVPIAAAPAPTADGGRTAAWVLIGVGGALLAGAAVTGAMAAGKDSELDDLDSDAGNTSQSDYDAIQDDGRTLALTTDGLLLGGAASLITGGVLLFSGGDETTAYDPLTAPSAGAATYSFER